MCCTQAACAICGTYTIPYTVTLESQELNDYCLLALQFLAAFDGSVPSILLEVESYGLLKYTLHPLPAHMLAGMQ